MDESDAMETEVIPMNIPFLLYIERISISHQLIDRQAFHLRSYP